MTVHIIFKRTYPRHEKNMVCNENNPPIPGPSQHTHTEQIGKSHPTKTGRIYNAILTDIVFYLFGASAIALFSSLLHHSVWLQFLGYHNPIMGCSFPQAMVKIGVIGMGPIPIYPNTPKISKGFVNLLAAFFFFCW